MGGALTRGLRGYSRKWLSLGCVPQSSMLGPTMYYSCCASGGSIPTVLRPSGTSDQTLGLVCATMSANLLCIVIWQHSLFSFCYHLTSSLFRKQKFIDFIEFIDSQKVYLWVDYVGKRLHKGSDESIIVRALVCSQTLASTCCWGKWWLGHTSQHSELNLSLCSGITPGGVWEFGWRPYVVLGIKLKLATYKAKCLTHWTITLSHPHCLTECGLL